MDLRELPQQAGHRHPWELARFFFFHRVLRDFAGLKQARTILDVGSGDGWFAQQLAARSPARERIVCWDSGYSDGALKRTALPGDERIEPRSQRPRGHFDLILLLDVLEHVEDDVGFLRELVDENLDSGTVLISVPAWPALTSSHDKALLHYRRYSPTSLRRLLTTAGLRQVRGGGLFHSLLIPRGLTVARERMRLEGGDARSQAEGLRWTPGAFVTRIVLGALYTDNLLSYAVSSTGLHIPGLSAWALCRRR